MDPAQKYRYEMSLVMNTEFTLYTQKLNSNRVTRRPFLLSAYLSFLSKRLLMLIKKYNTKPMHWCTQRNHKHCCCNSCKGYGHV